MEYFFLISAITKYEYFEPILYTEKAALNNNWSFFFLSHMIDSMYTFLKIIRTIVNTWGFQDRYLPHLIHIKITKAYISVIIVKTKTSRLTLSSIVYSTLDFISHSHWMSVWLSSNMNSTSSQGCKKSLLLPFRTGSYIFCHFWPEDHIYLRVSWFYKKWTSAYN